MLKQRVLTALVLIPLTVWAIFGLHTQYLGAVFAILVLMGSWEWTRLVPLANPLSRVVYLASIAVFLIGAWILLTQRGTVVPLLGAALIWWIVATIWVARYRGEGAGGQPFKVIAGWLTLVPAWSALVGLHALPVRGPSILLFVLVLLWVADSGAYFSGRLWGKHKLAPHVSPGKTWEGVAGGVVAAGIYAAAGAYFFEFKNYELVLFVIISVITVGFSIVGDLLESLLKRQKGVKDSGALLPGHGGVLDRVDSVTAGAPVFLLGYSVVEWTV